MDAPDSGKFPIMRWGTFSPSRKPQFKMHASLGYAKGALGVRHVSGEGRYVTESRRTQYEHPLEEGWLYELVGGKWKLKASVERGDFKTDHHLWQKQHIIKEMPEL